MGAFTNTFGKVIKGSELNPFCKEYKAVYEAMSVKPSADDAMIQNALLKYFVDKGYYAKMELIDIFATHDGGQNINWKSPGVHDPSPVNSPPFAAYEGYTGVSTGSKYIRLNFIPSIDAKLMMRDDAFAMIGTGTNVVSSMWDFGALGDVSHFAIQASGSTGYSSFVCNQKSGVTAGNTAGGANPTTSSHLYMARSSADTIRRGVN